MWNYLWEIYQTGKTVTTKHHQRRGFDPNKKCCFDLFYFGYEFDGRMALHLKKLLLMRCYSQKNQQYKYIRNL
jgi:hypothetical protein